MWGQRPGQSASLRKGGPNENQHQQQELQSERKPHQQHREKDGEVVQDSEIVDTILKSVKDNMSLKHLQDSEDQAFV